MSDCLALGLVPAKMELASRADPVRHHVVQGARFVMSAGSAFSARLATIFIIMNASGVMKLTRGSCRVFQYAKKNHF
jgi:hypothetical protein